MARTMTDIMGVKAITAEAKHSDEGGTWLYVRLDDGDADLRLYIPSRLRPDHRTYAELVSQALESAASAAAQAADAEREAA